MYIFQTLGPTKSNAQSLQTCLENGWKLSLIAMSDDLLRIVVEPDAGLPESRTWMIAPEGDTPFEGRSRDDKKGFAATTLSCRKLAAGGMLITTPKFRVTLTDSPVRLAVEQKRGNKWLPWISDRETGGFALVEQGRKIRHFQRREAGDQYFGLGDKTGPLNRHGRRFRVLQLDALGYDAEIGDPLYKHIPFMMARTGSGKNAVTGGLFYDTLAPVTFDLGCERSNYHGFYRYVEAEERGLDLWLIAGPDVASVTRKFTVLTGRPTLPPRWSFGFAFTTMHHADDLNAQAVISDFADRCRMEQIPLSSIHFGSGYSSRGPKRYVFTWNRDKFPQPAALFAKLKGMELPTVANIKPVLLDDHPDYASVKASGGFVTDGNGTPITEQFWDGMGSYLDFTNPQTIQWWQSRLKSEVLDVGFTAGWNDNNEYEIGRDGARSTGFGKSLDATASRPLYALLMMRATFEATKALNPDFRPFTITRAGPAGIQRYGETWTGDNFTSWHTLKWNLRNALSLALSGQSKVGHDIGGFTGSRPDAELLCRFVEMMALHPRAVMNSWKPDVAPDWQAATHPWTHPEVLPQIRNALNLRTTFLPLMYSLAFDYHQSGIPIIRPLFHDFPDDPRSFEDHDALMLGPDVLFSPVVTQGARKKTQYLPKGPFSWVHFQTGKLYKSGSRVTVSAELGQPPIFVRTGAVLVLAGSTPVLKPHDAPGRRLYIATPGLSGAGNGRHFEDDGLSWGFQSGKCLELDMAANWTATDIEIRLTRKNGNWSIPEAANWVLDAPLAEGRKVSIKV